AVECRGTQAETIRQAGDAAAMLAVDDHFALAINAGQARAAWDIDGVPQAVFRRMAMLKRFGPFAGQVEMEQAAVNRVQSVHGVVNGQERKVVLPAPVAEPIFLGRGKAILAWLAGPHKAVHVAERIVPGTAADAFTKGDRHRPCRADGRGITHVPERAAADGGLCIFLETVD